MTTPIIPLLFIVIVIIALAMSLKIAPEGERFAIFTLGRFHSFAGPGLVLIMPFTQRTITLKIGDLGQLNSREFATFGNVTIPVTDTESINIGQLVRIEGFDGVKPRLVASATRPTNHCPKCGHSF